MNETERLQAADGRVIKLKDCEKGEFLHLLDKKGIPHKKVYQRGEYDRSARRYRIDDVDDISRDRLIAGERLVYIGFTY